MSVVAVTGASAGVGRACVRAFARRGDDVALLARDEDRLAAAAEEVRVLGGRALVLPIDVADATAVEAAAERIEAELGTIDVWVNDAMTSVFAPLESLTAEETRRVTEVTYLGTVHGTMAALRRMRPRDRGVIVQVGSALAYRSIPLQAAYCGAKSAVRGFTDSVRCELLHDGSNVRIAMVHLPAINTPQFAWVRSRLPRAAQPVPPIYQPEVAARAIVFAAEHPRRELLVGWSTHLALLGQRFVPGLMDRHLADAAWAGQQTDDPERPGRPDDLDDPVRVDVGAHGTFDARASDRSPLLWADMHRGSLAAGGVVAGGVVAAGVTATRMLARMRR
jgi:NAD(P)-dependent dehydrogenase (short-subunit alcohol dehydrogenase family)